MSQLQSLQKERTLRRSLIESNSVYSGIGKGVRSSYNLGPNQPQSPDLKLGRVVGTRQPNAMQSYKAQGR